MPYCPQCEAEYQDGVETCTDCQVPLVAALADSEELHDDDHADPVVLRNFANAAEARMVEGLLMENGIRAFVNGGDFTVAPSGFGDEIVLMVDERDLARATELHDAYFGNQAAPENQPVLNETHDGEA